MVKIWFLFLFFCNNSNYCLKFDHKKNIYIKMDMNNLWNNFSMWRKCEKKIIHYNFMIKSLTYYSLSLSHVWNLSLSLSLCINISFVNISPFLFIFLITIFNAFFNNNINMKCMPHFLTEGINFLKKKKVYGEPKEFY